MKKRFLLIGLLVTMLFLPTGCIKRDNMEDIKIYTSSYPVEYITNYLYGSNSTVKSIYPDGVITSQYELTDMELKEYSAGNLFVFNGLSKEKNYVNKMLKENNDLKIIDSTRSMEEEFGEAELWINPSNMLMIMKNIKLGLDEYISNQYLKNDINNKYEELKLTISKLEAKIYFMVENSDQKSIVVGTDMLNFLSKYGMDVYSLDEKKELTDKTKEAVKSKINSGEIKYIFLLDEGEKTDYINSLVNTGKVSIVYLNDLSNLSESDRKDNKDYLSLMNDNLDLIRQELYTN